MDNSLLVDLEERTVETLVDRYLKDDSFFDTKNIVVTGGASGIGEQVSRGLKQLGANVLIIDKMKQPEWVNENYFECDLGDDVQIKNTLENINSRFQVFDGLINCAAEFPFYLFQDIPMDEWDRINQVNLRAPVQLIKNFLPKFNKGSAIVNFLTIEGGLPFASAYCSSKSGSRSLLMSLASELSDEKYIFGFSPGVVFTNLAVEVFSKFAAAGGITLEQFVESSVDNPGYEKMMPAQHCAISLISALKEPQVNHGNVIEPFTYLEKLGLTSKEIVSDKQASGPITEYLHELKTMGQFVENKIYERTIGLSNERDQLAYLLEEIKLKAEHNERLNKQLRMEMDQKELYYKELVRRSQMAALGEMAGGIAHEINNPLNIIKNIAEFIKIKSSRNELDLEFIRKNSSKIVDTSNRISKIVNSIKLLSQDSGDDTFAPTDVSDVVNYVTHIANEKLKNSNVNFETKVSVSENSKINCRMAQISQVLVNFFNNSLDACRNTKSPQVDLLIEQKDNLIKFTVRDNGTGIPKEDRDKVLNPFFSTKDESNGTGLGLSISSKILDDHDSKIDFNSDEGETEFSFTLPPISA